MGKILNYKHSDNTIIMTVQLEGGNKQEWTYIREKTALGYNYLMIDRKEL